jgi:hypothetical protein
MPSLAEHQSNEFVKILYLGDAKSGKTTSLVSLVKAGYRLFILDMDNLLDSLKYAVLKECPDKIGNVEFRTLRDKYKAGPTGPEIDGVPNAFLNAMKMLDNWTYKDGEDKIEYGKPKEWGSDCILVIDSLSRLCDAAYDYHHFLIKPGKSGEIDGRAVYGNAQDAVEMVLAGLTSKTFETNVIVICHGQYMDLEDKTKKIYPQGVGQKLSPKIPQYFPVYVRLKNFAGNRVVQLESDAMIDLAMPRLDKLKEKTLPADTGLATIFETLRGKPPAKVKPQPAATVVEKPKAVTLQRRV